MGPQLLSRYKLPQESETTTPSRSEAENDKLRPSETPQRSKTNENPSPLLSPVSGTERWAPHWNLPQRESWVDLLRGLGRRPACSNKERRTFASLHRSLFSRYASTKWHAMAVSAPLWPPTFFYSCVAVVLFGLSWFAPIGTAVIGGVATFCLWEELRGSFRYSQLVFAPRSTSYLSVVQEPKPEAPRLIICAGVDTPTGDLVYDSEPYDSWLRGAARQGITPGLLLLIGVASLPVFNLIRISFSVPFPGYLIVAQGACLGGLCLLFYVTSERKGNTTHNNVAVAAAIETYEQLSHIDMPFQTELLLMGCSSQGLGMESWIRQNSHRYPKENTYILVVAPSARTATHLYYRTHEGPLQRIPMNNSVLSAAEQIALRFATEMNLDASPGPQRRFGSSMASVANKHGYAAVTLGANFSSPTETPVAHHLVGWTVACAQSIGLTGKQQPTEQASTENQRTS